MFTADNNGMDGRASRTGNLGQGLRQGSQIAAGNADHLDHVLLVYRRTVVLGCATGLRGGSVGRRGASRVGLARRAGGSDRALSHRSVEPWDEVCHGFLHARRSRHHDGIARRIGNQPDATRIENPGKLPDETSGVGVIQAVHFHLSKLVRIRRDRRGHRTGQLSVFRPRQTRYTR